MPEEMKRVKTIFGREKKKKKKVRLCLPESDGNKVRRENELNLSRKREDLKEHEKAISSEDESGALPHIPAAPLSGAEFRPRSCSRLVDGPPAGSGALRGPRGEGSCEAPPPPPPPPVEHCPLWRLPGAAGRVDRAQRESRA